MAGVRSPGDPSVALMARDGRGRTPLFAAAETGDRAAVEAIIFALRGTGAFPPRLTLLEVRDDGGRTAADVAAQAGHADVARLLRDEAARMRLFE